MDLQFNPTRSFIKALDKIGSFIPAAERQAAVMRAREAFKDAADGYRYSDDPDIQRMRVQYIEDCIVKSGYDRNDDRGYNEVLGLAGGKAEFKNKTTLRGQSQIGLSGI